MQLHEPTDRVPVGQKYDRVTDTPVGTIETGETIVSWSDPEPHGILTDDDDVYTTSAVYTGVVDAIYHIESHDSIEISIKGAPLGRLDAERVTTERVDRYLSEAPEPTAGSITERWYAPTPWSDQAEPRTEYELDRNWYTKET